MSGASGIKEKVQFWQEQDKINQALIPRVMKLHDLVTGLSQTLEGTSESIANAESRAVQTSKKHVQQVQSEMESAVTASEASVRSDMNAQIETLKTELHGLQDEVASLADSSSGSAVSGVDDKKENEVSAATDTTGYVPTRQQMYVVYGATAAALLTSVLALVLTL